MVTHLLKIFKRTVKNRELSFYSIILYGVINEYFDKYFAFLKKLQGNVGNKSEEKLGWNHRNN